MPLLDSFKVDHTKMTAPAVRVAKTMKSKSGDTISVFDIRIHVPNQDKMTGKGIHTLEHLFAGFIRTHLNSKNVEIIERVHIFKILEYSISIFPEILKPICILNYLQYFKK